MNGGRNPDSEKPIIDTCPGGWEITDPTRSGSNSLLLKSQNQLWVGNGIQPNAARLLVEEWALPGQQISTLL